MKLRLGFLWLILLCSINLFATTYTVTAPHYTMHVGDLVPPCILQISNGTTTVSESSTLFSGSASCSMGATSASSVGNYTITVSQGTLASLTGGDTINVVNSQITVIATDNEGAALSAVSYPPGLKSATRFPAIDVTSNGIANWVGDGSTDNADAILEILAMGSGTQLATVGVVTTTGTSTVTWTSGTQFTGLASGSPIIIDGLINSISSVTDATHLVTTSIVEGGATLTGVQLEFPPWVVNVSGTTVTAVSGPTFVGETGNIIIGQTTYTISSVTDATHLVLTTTGTTVTNTKMYEDAASCCSSGSGGSTPLNLYIPAGVYATSQPVHLYLNYWQLMGVGPQSSIIKLLPNSAAFNTGTNTEFVNPQSVGGNQNFHQFLFNLGIEIGRGNPNAIPLTSEMNNVAAIRNVQVWADDSVCPFAFDLRRGFPGPMLVKNFALYGCTNGISSNQNEYTTVFEGLTTEGQLGLVVDPTSHNMAIRHVLSDNTGQFLSTGASTPYGVVSLLDSEILNGSGSATGIAVAAGGSVYVKNLHVTGYLHSIVDSSTGTPVTLNGDVAQSWSGPAQSLFGGTPDSLHLPENETPIPSDPSPSTWTVLDSTVANWPTEISGSASTTVYAPPGGYNTTAGTVTVTVPDTVNHILFYQSKRSDNSNYVLQLNVAGTSSTPLVIDGCPYTECNVNHTGSRTIVLLDSVLNQYTAAPGAGDLYIEDSILAGTLSATVPTFYSSQHIWARHLNLEAHNINKFDCEGCTIWVLGYKTEEPFPNMILNNGAKGEFFTTFMYSNVAPTGGQLSQIQLSNSSIFISSVIDKVDVAGRGNLNWVTETRNATTLNLPTSTVNSSLNLPMYYSLGSNPIFTTLNPTGKALQ